MAAPFDTPQQQRSSDQVTARANLLAGLRTGGRRSGSPATFQQQQQQNFSPSLNRQMKPNAAVFQPNAGQQLQYSPTAELGGSDYMGNLELQMAALQMSAMQSTPTVAASYGASLGQPQSQTPSRQQQADMKEHLLRVQQQQQLYQQQQALQQQLDNLRFQSAANQAQQQQQQQANLGGGGQQRALFAQIQAEYDNQVSRSQQLQQLQQRQAAQDAIQTNARNRQVAQIYSQLLEEDEQGLLDRRMLNGRDLWQVAVDYVNNEHAEAHLAACQEQERLQQYYTHLQHLQQQTQEALENQRALSDAAAAATAGRASPATQRPQPTPAAVRSGQADKAANWRTRSSLGPTIVVEDNSDSESRKSSPRSSRSFNSADETPQTSEEDVAATTPPSVAAAINKLSAKVATNARRESWTPPSATGTASPVQYASKTLPRAVALSAAPRPRRSTEASLASNMIQASRQPRGPPTEFHELNFASRKKAQLRKEALSKLRSCSSPRVSAAGATTVTA